MKSDTWTLFKKLGEVRRNERLDRAHLEAAKLRKFRELVLYAGTHSPYYARLITSLGIQPERCMPQDFPVLTKSTLLAHFDDIVTDRRVTREALTRFLAQSHDPEDAFLDTYRVIHTSGSSGEVGYFVYSAADWARGMAQQMRSRPKATRRNPDRQRGRLRMAYYGAIDGHFAGVSMGSSIKNGLMRFFVNMQMFEVNNPLADVVAELNAFQPDIIIGYTGALKMLAAEQRDQRLRLTLGGIGTVGEGMSPLDRQVLQQAFGCDVRGTYASSEHLTMGVLEGDGDNMLLRDDDLMYELHADHTVVTNLFNFTLPLIRYRMADVMQPASASTGLSATPYLRIGSLIGRSEQAPVFINDAGERDFISPHTINEIFVPGITGFQMRLQDGAGFRFVVCVDEALTGDARVRAVDGVRVRLNEILAQKRMTKVPFDVEVIERLPLNLRTRKFQLIVHDTTA